MMTGFNLGLAIDRQFYGVRAIVASLLAVGVCLTSACTADRPAGESSAETKWVDDPASFVNPFIGTEGVRTHRQAANTVPGRALDSLVVKIGTQPALHFLYCQALAQGQLFYLVYR